MIDPAALGAGAQVAGAALKLPLAIYQLVKANQLKRNRPEYDIPDEVMQNQNIAKTMALEGLPAAQYNRAQANIDRNTAFGARTLGSRRAGIAGLSALEQGANDAYANLDAADAAARRQNQGVLMGQNQNVAQYRDKQWQLNELEPWQIDMQAAAAMEGAGINNLYNMFNKVADTTSQYQYMNLWKSLNGGGNSGEGANAQISAMGNPVPNTPNMPVTYQQPIGMTEPYYNFGG